MRIKFLLTLMAVFLASVGSVASPTTGPRYIFYFIGDGMGFGVLSSTMAFNRAMNGGPDKMTMTMLPVASAITTYSASSLPAPLSPQAIRPRTACSVWMPIP